jgi:DNA mismatch repair protein MutS
MEIDKVTFNDLSIFNSEESFSVFHKLNFTRTSEGREWLIKFFKEPLGDLQTIRDTQQILRLIIQKEKEWPTYITNGTIMVIYKFYEYAVDEYPDRANLLNSAIYRLLHRHDYSLTRFSLTHIVDFIKGVSAFPGIFTSESTPAFLLHYINRIEQILNRPEIAELLNIESAKELSPAESLALGYFFRNQFKNQLLELIQIFSRLDAYYSMAIAVKTHNLCFPEFIEQDQPLIEADRLYHLLLERPVAYDTRLDPSHNFLFLTGANMAGKSTYIKSVGTAVFLAHLGMGVPARAFKLTMFSGLLSNIQVEDNIVKGESYFFNEVQRIKNTILKINDNRKWLILIDELFKGTNVQDAMKCSTTVIKGLIRIKHSLFILSTHLYEIGEELKVFPNISFRYLETTVKNGQLSFSYQLKEGVSNDRIGYLILQREKVVELLERL